MPTSEDSAKELLSRAEVLRACAGSGVPAVLEVVRAETGPVLVLERTPGPSLAEWVTRAQPNLAVALEMAVQIAEVLARVHGAHLVHRSIHPFSIYVDEHHLSVYVANFAHAQALGQTAPLDLVMLEERAALAYVAPEQTGRMNRGVDGRSDLYSLGATLYFLFTRRPPFD